MIVDVFKSIDRCEDMACAICGYERTPFKYTLLSYAFTTDQQKQPRDYTPSCTLRRRHYIKPRQAVTCSVIVGDASGLSVVS